MKYKKQKKKQKKTEPEKKKNTNKNDRKIYLRSGNKKRKILLKKIYMIIQIIIEIIIAKIKTIFVIK